MTTIDIAALIAESEELERLMREWQTTAPSNDELDDVRRRYREFLAQGKQILDDERKVEFQKQHDGSFGDTDISDFLADPRGRSPFFDTPEHQATELVWKVGFATHIAPNLPSSVIFSKKPDFRLPILSNCCRRGRRRSVGCQHSSEC